MQIRLHPSFILYEITEKRCTRHVRMFIRGGGPNCTQNDDENSPFNRSFPGESLTIQVEYVSSKRIREKKDVLHPTRNIKYIDYGPSTKR